MSGNWYRGISFFPDSGTNQIVPQLVQGKDLASEFAFIRSSRTDRRRVVNQTTSIETGRGIPPAVGQKARGSGALLLMGMGSFTYEISYSPREIISFTTALRSQPSGREPFTPPIFILWTLPYRAAAALLDFVFSRDRTNHSSGCQGESSPTAICASSLRRVLRLQLLLRFFQGGGLSWLLEACSMRCPSVPWKRFPLIFLTSLTRNESFSNSW